MEVKESKYSDIDAIKNPRINKGLKNKLENEGQGISDSLLYKSTVYTKE